MAVINAFYPIKKGNTWTYQSIHYSGSAAMDTTIKIQQITDMGTIISEDGYPKEWWSFNYHSPKIINQNKSQYQLTSSYTGDVCTKKLDVTFYYTTSLEPTIFTESTHVAVNSWTYKRSSDTIITPAGTFTNCIKESISYEGVFTTSYYADGVGLVKQTLVFGPDYSVDLLQSYFFH